MRGFAGIILIMGFGKAIFSIYVFFPITAAFGYALSSVMMKLFPKELSTAQIQFGTQVINLITAIFLMLTFGGLNPVYSFVMGTAGVLGVMCLVSAYRTLEPRILALSEYFGMPLPLYSGGYFFVNSLFHSFFPDNYLLLSQGHLSYGEKSRRQIMPIRSTLIGRRTRLRTAHTTCTVQW